MNSDPKAWYNRFVEANTLFDQTTAENSKLRQRNSRLQEKNNSLTNELTHQQGILEYQKKETDRVTDRLTDRFNAEIRRIENESRDQNEPNRQNKHDQPEPAPAHTAPAHTAPAHTDPAHTAPAHNILSLSERVPDPTLFMGDRADLSRFLEQIRAKMIANGDRYRTPQARNIYVLSRLEGLAYQQVHPHVKGGIPQFEDYEEMLDLLNHSFGDPNLATRSTQKLHALKQQNKDFNVFYAEFQRLALESGLDDLSLVPILERAISSELKQSLVYCKPQPGIHALARQLQDTDTRQRYFSPEPLRPSSRYQYPTNQSSTSTAPRYQPSAYQTPRYPSPTPSSYSSVVARNTPAPQRVTGRITEPMDLSSTRRTNLSDKETGNCFRCHQSGHRIRNCPLPDNRPQNSQRRNSGYQVNAISRSPSPESSRSRPRQRQIAYQTQASSSRQPVPANHMDEDSENGVPLG